MIHGLVLCGRPPKKPGIYILTFIVRKFVSGAMLR